MNARIRALNRFGLGARRNESQAISDPRGWLRAQLDGGAPVLSAPDGASPAAITDAIDTFRQAGQGDPQQRQMARRRLVEIAAPKA